MAMAIKSKKIRKFEGLSCNDMFAQFIVNGLISGLMYSLLGIGFALVYNTTKVFHIAAAALYVIASYLFWCAFEIFHFPLFLSAVVAIIFTSVVSLLCELLVYRPLHKKKAGDNVCMIASIGLMTILVNVIALIFGNETKVIKTSGSGHIVFCNIILTQPQLYQVFFGVLALGLFAVITNKSMLGVKLRALSCDQNLFNVLGYDIRKVRNQAFILSGLLISLASCLTSNDVGMDPNMGMAVLMNAMVAMIVGGLGRYEACIMGGLLLGVLQASVVYFFSSSWQNAVTFVVLLIFLFLRPQGIIGLKNRSF